MCSIPGLSPSGHSTTSRFLNTSRTSVPGVLLAPVTVPMALSPASINAWAAFSPSTRTTSSSSGQSSTNCEPYKGSSSTLVPFRPNVRPGCSHHTCLSPLGVYSRMWQATMRPARSRSGYSTLASFLLSRLIDSMLQEPLRVPAANAPETPKFKRGDSFPRQKLICISAAALEVLSQLLRGQDLTVLCPLRHAALLSDRLPLPNRKGRRQRGRAVASYHPARISQGLSISLQRPARHLAPIGAALAGLFQRSLLRDRRLRVRYSVV